MHELLSLFAPLLVIAVVLSPTALMCAVVRITNASYYDQPSAPVRVIDVGEERGESDVVMLGLLAIASLVLLVICALTGAWALTGGTMACTAMCALRVDMFSLSCSHCGEAPCVTNGYEDVTGEPRCEACVTRSYRALQADLARVTLDVRTEGASAQEEGTELEVVESTRAVAYVAGQLDRAWRRENSPYVEGPTSPAEIAAMSDWTGEAREPWADFVQGMRLDALLRADHYGDPSCDCTAVMTPSDRARESGLHDPTCSMYDPQGDDN